MISQTAEYALRAIICIAEHNPTPCITQDVAKATHVPAGYLSKVLQSLCRAGLLTSQRGLGGGFTLKKNPTEISIYSVVQAVDPIQRITACPLGRVHENAILCPLHRRLDDAIAMVEKTFKETTLSEMLKGRQEHGVLCPHQFLNYKPNETGCECGPESAVPAAPASRLAKRGQTAKKSSNREDRQEECENG